MKNLLLLTVIGLTLLACNSESDDVLNDSDYAEYMERLRKRPFYSIKKQETQPI